MSQASFKRTFSPSFCPTCHLESCECVIHQGRFEEIKHLQDESDQCEQCWEEAYGSVTQSLIRLGDRGVGDPDDHLADNEADGRTRQAFRSLVDAYQKAKR